MSKARLGTHPTAETLKNMAEAHKGQGLGRHLSDKTREKMRLNYRGGAKRALYNNTWFRSGWEAKYAEYLDTWNIKWEYEKYTFLLEIDGKKTSYIPDFYLPEFNFYHEVKGWSHNLELGLKKVQLAREQHDINLTVIDSELLKRMGVI